MEDKTMEKRKGKKKKFWIAGIALIAAVALVAGLVWSRSTSQYEEVAVQTRDMSSYLEFSGNVEASETREVRSSVSAKVLEVPVEEGDTVKKGDVIAVLDSSDVEYNIEIQQAALEAAQASDYYNVRDSQRTLDQYNEALASGLNTSADTAQDSLMSAQQQYQEAVDAYNKARTDLENGDTSAVVTARQTMDSQAAAYTSAEQQHDNHMITDEALNTYWVSYSNAKESYELAVAEAQKAVDDAYDAVTEAEEALAQAERNYEATALTTEQTQENYEESLEKVQALANQESTQLQIDQLRDSLDDYTIYAPIDGVVTQLNIHEGDLLASAASTQGVAQIADLDTMKVAVKINEQDAVSVKEGDAVSVYVDALGTSYDGTITKISRTGTIENDTVYVTAEVQFEADDQVRSGYSAEITLIKEEAKDAICLPVSAISYRTDNTAYVNVRAENGKLQEQTVSLGISDGEYVQITDGLSAGDTVYLVQQTGTLVEQRMQEQQQAMENMQEEAGS
ncbi:MAG: efflux RND transporter periplasmic adaptor subunit [Eubacteriales bacterium]|nr:efflux RND transporter periplasmic adaptor subunit [Eubacteriales bacterium]